MSNVGLIMPARLQQPRLSLVQRQPDAKGGSLPDMALEFYQAPVLAHDALNDHQTQPRPLLFGGEKRFENAVQLVRRYAAAGIANADPDTLRARASLHRPHAAFARRLP